MQDAISTHALAESIKDINTSLDIGLNIQGGIDLEAAVDIDAARVEPFGQAVDALDVVRLDIGGQAVFAVVGNGDRLVLGLEPDDRHGGSEDFDLGDFMVGVHVDHDRRLDEVALGQIPARALAADQEFAGVKFDTVSTETEKLRFYKFCSNSFSIFSTRVTLFKLSEVVLG